MTSSSPAMQVRQMFQAPERRIVLWVLISWAAGVLRLFYGRGSGEHDTFMMAASIVRGVHSGEAINVYAYGQQVQFLFYYLGYWLSKPFAPTPGDVLLVMNIAGAVCALLFALLTLHVLKRLIPDPDSAALPIVLLISSPMYYYLLSYGHPFHLGFVLLLIAWVVLLKAIDLSPSPQRTLLSALAILLHSLALMTRFEQVLLASGLFLGLLSVRERYRFARLLTPAVVLAASFAVFFAFRFVLVPPDAGAVSARPNSFSNNFVVLLRLFEPRLIKWGVTQMLVGVGLPLLALGAMAFLVGVRRVRLDVLVTLAFGVLPSVAIYLGNPSPPRHFLVLTLGLGCLVAIALEGRWLRGIRRAAVGILVVNLALPWALIAVDDKPYPERANVTFNVIERTDRNRAEIAETEPFYRGVLTEAGRGPVVLFGSWIHFAQIAAMTSEDPQVQITRTVLPGEIRALTLSRQGLTVHFVETYDPGFAIAGVKKLKEAAAGFRCVSVVEGAVPTNDLGLKIPAAVLWWNA